MAVSLVSKAFAGEAFYTAMAGVGAKGVGSGFRVWDDRHAPSQVKKNTLKREAATLTQVSAYTYLIDTVMQKLLGKGGQATSAMAGEISSKTQALIQKAANRKILLKAIPVSAGIFLAEAIGRKLAPREIWDEDGTLNDDISDSDDDAHEIDDDDDDDDDDEHKEKGWQAPYPGNPPNPVFKTFSPTFSQAANEQRRFDFIPKSLPLNPFSQGGMSARY